MLYRLLGYEKVERDNRALNRTWTEAYQAHRRQLRKVFWGVCILTLALLYALLKVSGL